MGSVFFFLEITKTMGCLTIFTCSRLYVGAKDQLQNDICICRSAEPGTNACFDYCSIYC